MSKVQNLKFKIQNSKFNTPVLLYTCAFVAFSIFFALTFSSCDKEDKLYGRWRLQTAYMNGDTITDSLQYNVLKNSIYTFFYANSFTITTFAHGMVTTSTEGYYRFTSKSTINLRYTILYQAHDLSATITKLTRNELRLEYDDDDNGNHYLLILYTY